MLIEFLASLQKGDYEYSAKVASEILKQDPNHAQAQAFLSIYQTRKEEILALNSVTQENQLNDDDESSGSEGSSASGEEEEEESDSSDKSGEEEEPPMEEIQRKPPTLTTAPPNLKAPPVSKPKPLPKK